MLGVQGSVSSGVNLKKKKNPEKFNSACGNGYDFQFFTFNSLSISGYGKLEQVEICTINRIIHMKCILIQNVLSCPEDNQLLKQPLHP